MEKDEVKKCTNKLTVQWYNQNPQLYRTYLQSLFLKLPNKDQSQRQKELAQNIKHYLSSQKQLQQIIFQKQMNNASAISEEEVYSQDLNKLNKQIEAYEESIYKINDQIQVKHHGQRILRRILKMQLQNFKKVYMGFRRAIECESHLEDENSFRDEDFFRVNLSDLDNNLELNFLNVLKRDVVDYNQKIKQKQAPQQLPKLQLKRVQTIAEIQYLFEKEPFQIQIQRLYNQKEETLNQLKKSQQEIQETERNNQRLQSIYTHNLAQNSLIQQETNRIKLHTNDLRDLALDPIQYQFQQLPEEEQKVQPFKSKENKKIIFQQENPKVVHRYLFYWTILLVISFILINRQAK